jgi:hypothetical protein
MVNRIHLITDFWIKREKESTFGVLAKFDSRINSWGDLVRESGARPNRCTYVLKETRWTRSEPFITRPELKWHSRNHSESNRALGNFAKVGRSYWSGLKLACQALGGCWQCLVLWVPRLLDLVEMNRAGLPWVGPLSLRTQGRRLITEAV